MYKCHDLILTNFTGTYSIRDFQIGFSGAIFRDDEESPDGINGQSITFDARMELSDFEDYNEAGLPADDLRDLENYSRHDVDWTVTRDNRGVIIDTGWHTWTSRIPWDETVAGSTEPCDWDTTDPGYEWFEPFPWADGYPWEKGFDFPWNRPYHNSWYWVTHSGCSMTIQEQNPWNVESSTMDSLGMLGSSSYPVGTAFVTVKRGAGWEIFAAAKLNGPTWWRRSGNINIKYRARFG